MNKTLNLYAFVVIGFIGCTLLFLVIENEQQVFQIFDSWNADNFKVWASTDEEEEEEKEVEEDDKTEAKICSKLFDSETCEKMQEDKPIEKKELTEEEIKAEAIVNRYLEPIDSEKKSSDNTTDSKLERSSGSNNSSSGSTKLLDEMKSKNITNSNQQIQNESVSKQKVNQSSINNTNVLTNTNQTLDNLNQFQLVDLISSTISNANNIDKNKIIQSINDFIEPTKAKGGNVIDSLKKVADVILKDPSGSTANKIISLDKTK